MTGEFHVSPAPPAATGHAPGEGAGRRASRGEQGSSQPVPSPGRSGIGAWMARFIDRAVSAVLIAGVVAYKVTLSPLLGRHCRFQPTCSSYFRAAVEKHGALRGSLRGLARICRCHPWHPGGFDPP